MRHVHNSARAASEGDQISRFCIRPTSTADHPIFVFLKIALHFSVRLHAVPPAPQIQPGAPIGRCAALHLLHLKIPPIDPYFVPNPTLYTTPRRPYIYFPTRPYF